MERIFIFGLGYSASHIAARLRALGWEIISTGRDGDLAFDDEGAVRLALADSSHVLSSVPPDGTGIDPVLQRYGGNISGKWLGYLSSTGVYGDSGGAWVDETAPIAGFGAAGRRTARAEADISWQQLGARVFRLPGIYGPGRSALERVQQGKAHRIDLPNQIFSRVHVEDIASGVVAGLVGPPGVYNLADDRPCSQNAVIEEAARLMGFDAPPMQSLDEAGLSPMARGFYAENRRVANGKAKRVMGWVVCYPTYVEGLRAVMEMTMPTSTSTPPPVASNVQ